MCSCNHLCAASCVETLLWTGVDQVCSCHLILLSITLVSPAGVCDVLLQIESLHRLSREVTHLDDVIVLHSWLQVDLRPFRESLLSVIHDWRRMYTEHLLDRWSDR